MVSNFGGYIYIYIYDCPSLMRSELVSRGMRFGSPGQWLLFGFPFVVVKLINLKKGWPSSTRVSGQRGFEPTKRGDPANKNKAVGSLPRRLALVSCQLG